MKSISQGIVRLRIRSAMKKTAPLSTPIRSRSRPGVVGGDLLAELLDALLEDVAVDQHLGDGLLELGRAHLAHRETRRLNAGRLDDPGHGHDDVAADHQRPRLALGTGDLRVDEQVLDLLPPPGEPVAGPPASYLKPCQLRANAPRPPAHLAGEVDRAVLEPEPVVLAHRLDAAAEIDALRARPARRAARRARARASRACRAHEGGSRRRPGCRRRSSGRISSRMRPRFVPALLESIRNASPSAVQYSSVSARQTPSSGRTTPSARRSSMPAAVPRETSR